MSLEIKTFEYFISGFAIFLFLTGLRIRGLKVHQVLKVNKVLYKLYNFTNFINYFLGLFAPYLLLCCPDFVHRNDDYKIVDPRFALQIGTFLLRTLCTIFRSLLFTAFNS